MEPGLIELAIGSSADLRLHGELELTGPERRAGAGRVLTTPVSVTALADGDEPAGQAVDPVSLHFFDPDSGPGRGGGIAV